MSTRSSLIVFAAVAAASSISTRAFADEPGTGGKVPVVIAPADRDGVELREVVGTSTMVGYANGRSVTAVATHYNTLCVAPCATAVMPGTKLVVAGDDFPTSSEFRAPRREQKLTVEPGSSVGSFFGGTLFLLGATAVITGGTLVGVSMIGDDRAGMRTVGLATLAGGALFTGSGLALAYSSATRVNDEHGARVASGSAGRSFTLGFGGRF